MSVGAGQQRHRGQGSFGIRGRWVVLSWRREQGASTEPLGLGLSRVIQTKAYWKIAKFRERCFWTSLFPRYDPAFSKVHLGIPEASTGGELWPHSKTLPEKWAISLLS